MVGRPRAGQEKLDSRLIIETALKVLDDGGLDGLTTRRLAMELGVKSPALYWHFRDKQDLLGWLKEEILITCLANTDDIVDWRDKCRVLCRAMRTETLKHRDGALLVVLGPLTEKLRTHLIPELWKPFEAAGFDVTAARQATATLMSFMLGWMIYEQSTPTHEFMAGMLDLDDAFEAGLEIQLAGMETVLSKTQAIKRASGKAIKQPGKTPTKTKETRDNKPKTASSRQGGKWSPTTPI